NGPVDSIPDPHLTQLLGPTIGHEDRRVTPEAINTLMTASSVRIDGPAEGDARDLGDAVDDRLGADLVEGDALELRGVEAADDGALIEEGEGNPVPRCRIDELEVVPPHDRGVILYRTDVRVQDRTARPGKMPRRGGSSSD